MLPTALLALTLSLTPAVAQDAPAPTPSATVVGPTEAHATVDRIEARYKDVETLSATFVQTVDSPLYGATTQEGTVVFQRPGKMRWDFEAEKKLYLTDGSSLWLVRLDDKQAFRYPSADPSGSPEALLHQLAHIRDLFDVHEVRTDGEGLTTVVLHPKGQASYASVTITLDAALTVSRVTVEDTMQTRTTLAFSGVQTDSSVPPETFTYTPPDGFDVVDAGAPP